MAKGMKNATKAKNVPEGQSAQQEAAGGSASTTVESMVPSETKTPVDSTTDESSTKKNQDVQVLQKSGEGAATELFSAKTDSTTSETKVSVDSSIVDAHNESSTETKQSSSSRGNDERPANASSGLDRDLRRAPFNESYVGFYNITIQNGNGERCISHWTDMQLDQDIETSLKRLCCNRLSNLQSILLPALCTNRDVNWQVGKGSLMAYSAIIGNKFAKEDIADREARSNGARPMAMVMVTTSQHAELVAEHFDNLRVPKMCVRVSTGIRRAERMAPNLEGCDVLIGTFVHLNNLVGHGHVNVNQVRVMVVDQYTKPGPQHFTNDGERLVREAIQNILELSPRSSKWLITNKWMPALDFWPTKLAAVEPLPIKITPKLDEHPRRFFHNNLQLNFYSFSTGEERIHRFFDALEGDESGHFQSTLVFCSSRRSISLVEKCKRRRYQAEFFTGYPVASDTEILLCTDKFAPDAIKAAHVVCLDYPEGEMMTIYETLKRRRSFLGYQKKVVFSIFYELTDGALLSGIRHFVCVMEGQVPDEIEEALRPLNFLRLSRKAFD